MVHDYLQDFKRDLNDPSYMWYLTYNSRQANPILLHNDSLMQELMSSSTVTVTVRFLYSNQ